MSEMKDYLVPLDANLLGCDVAVGVGQVAGDSVALGNLLHLVVDPEDGLPLGLRFWKCGFELVMGGDETLRQLGKDGPE